MKRERFCKGSLSLSANLALSVHALDPERPIRSQRHCASASARGGDEGELARETRRRGSHVYVRFTSADSTASAQALMHAFFATCLPNWRRLETPNSSIQEDSGRYWMTSPKSRVKNKAGSSQARLKYTERLVLVCIKFQCGVSASGMRKRRKMGRNRKPPVSHEAGTCRHVPACRWGYTSPG